MRPSNLDLTSGVVLGGFSLGIVAPAIWLAHEVEVVGLWVGPELSLILGGWVIFGGLTLLGGGSGGIGKDTLRLVLCWMVITCWIGLGVVVNGADLKSILYWLQMSAYMSLVGLVPLVVKTRRDVVLLLSVVAAVLIARYCQIGLTEVESVAGSVATINFGGEVIARPTFLGFSANALGAVAGVSIPMAYLLAAMSRGLFGITVASILAASSIVMIFVSFSRSALAAAFLGCLTLAVQHHRLVEKRAHGGITKGIIFGGALLGGGLITAWIQPGLMDFVVNERLLGSVVREGHVNIGPRYEVWEDSFSIWAGHDWYQFVVGLGFYPMPTDNSYLNMLVGTGIVGVVLVTLLGLYSWRWLRRRIGTSVATVAAATGGCIVLVFAGFTDIFASRKLLLVLAILVGVTLSYRQGPEEDYQI